MPGCRTDRMSRRPVQDCDDGTGVRARPDASRGVPPEPGRTEVAGAGRLLYLGGDDVAVGPDGTSDRDRIPPCHVPKGRGHRCGHGGRRRDHHAQFGAVELLEGETVAVDRRRLFPSPSRLGRRRKSARVPGWRLPAPGWRCVRRPTGRWRRNTRPRPRWCRRLSTGPTLTGTILTNAVEAVVCTATLWPFRSSRVRSDRRRIGPTPPVDPGRSPPSGSASGGTHCSDPGSGAAVVLVLPATGAGRRRRQPKRPRRRRRRRGRWCGPVGSAGSAPGPVALSPPGWSDTGGAGRAGGAGGQGSGIGAYRDGLVVVGGRPLRIGRVR